MTELLGILNNRLALSVGFWLTLLLLPQCWSLHALKVQVAILNPTHASLHGLFLIKLNSESVNLQCRYLSMHTFIHECTFDMKLQIFNHFDTNVHVSG